MKIDEIREGNTHQNKEGPKDVDDGLPQSETPLNLPQFVRKENDGEDQRDQYERKDDEVEKVKIHHSHSRRADPGLMASVLHSTWNKVNPSTRQRGAKVCSGLTLSAVERVKIKIFRL
jgi:hypothetical protein